MEKLETMCNIPIPIVAKLLGKSEQFVRIGLQRQLLPIGTAVQTSSQYSYYVSYELLKKFVGIERIKQYEDSLQESRQ